MYVEIVFLLIPFTNRAKSVIRDASSFKVEYLCYPSVIYFKSQKLTLLLESNLEKMFVLYGIVGYKHVFIFVFKIASH